LKFTQRFNIEIGLEEARRRFVNRIHNNIFNYYYYYRLSENTRFEVHREIVSALGDRYSYSKDLSTQIDDDFFRNLLALETFYHLGYTVIDQYIKKFLSESEVDLGVRWDNGRFIKSGAELLDNKLVNDVLDWLRDQKYITVIQPFEKGLLHFLHAENRPELLTDVVTDMYEALEALSMIITDRPNKDLSANRELFISKVKASIEYKKILSEYINYANEFRHAQEKGKSKPKILPKEAESFIYLTGLFIRLAIQ
jgi:hypothetical protein